MKKILFPSVIILILTFLAAAQVPTAIGIQILKAEDARRYDDVLEKLMSSPNAAVRARAALAAGRIGDEKAIPVLAGLLEKDAATEVRGMAAFALGEIESIKAADAIVLAMKDSQNSYTVVARLVEAAGKIVAANAKDEKAKPLGVAVVECLNTQSILKLMRDNDVTRLGITAVLRAKPQGGNVVVAKFLTDPDARIRADSANTLTRLRAKNANEILRKMLVSDPDAVARANAARALGAAEDKDAYDLLLKAATTDPDSRVRVSAIRSVGSLKDAKAADRLLDHAEQHFAEGQRSHSKRPAQNSELIEIATVLGRLLKGTGNDRAVKFLDAFALADGALTPDISIARLNIKATDDFDNSKKKDMGWRELSTDAQFLGAIADIDAKTDEAKKMKEEAPGLLLALLVVIQPGRETVTAEDLKAMPDVLTAYAKFKTKDLDEVLRLCLERDDVFLRAAAAGLIAEQPSSKENVDALNKAFSAALVKDSHDNDAELAILDALAKLDKKAGVGTFIVALSAPDYLLRKKAFEILDDKDLQKQFPGLPTTIENARTKHKDQVLPYPGFGTKLGQVLNTDADYRRALSRKNGSVKAVLTTQKGTFTIVFNPQEAPLTVDNFVKLARTGYFNGLEVHRVVPNFVMQDGDPRGDGNGGPGWSIRCEVNMLPYDRGAVGMALSGKDTGGSQWFVTHSPQPHLDGGYTVFGHVNEADMKVVDSIVRGDKILTVKIVGR